MSVDIDSVKSFLPVGSVVSDAGDDAVDKLQPLTYVEWLTRIRLTVTGSTDLTQQYNGYLRQWADISTKSNSSEDLIVGQYKTLIKDITLNYTTSEEKRFLSNINYDDPRHVESAIPFFANKIKQITAYYARERDVIKQQKVQSASSGSVAGIKRSTRNKIAQQLSSPSTTYDRQIDYSQSENIDVQYNVSLVELYDTSENYFKQDLAPVSLKTFNSTENIIADALKECLPVLHLSDSINVVLSNGAITQQDATQTIQNTNYSEFFNYIKSENNLNTLKVPVYVNTILGSSLMQLSGGELSYLNKPQAPWRNIYNRYKPAINITPDPPNTYKTLSELGGYNTPKKLGVLTYYSKAPKPVLSVNDSVDVLPDLYKYGRGSVPGISAVPVEHDEDIMWLKADDSNGRLFGDIVSDKSLAKFTGYTSRDEISKFPFTGVSRSTDNTGYFNGDRNHKWSNSDIFPEISNNIFDIDSRTDKLLIGHQTLCRWRTDIFGNEYALYKHIQPPRGPLDEPRVVYEDEDEGEVVVGCVVIDGGDTLSPRPGLYDVDVDYDIHEGGRSPGIDNKFEQSYNPRPFKDLRRPIGVDPDGAVELEEHNSWYVGVDPSPTRADSDIERRPITFHGFSPASTYDSQAYGGLFTDTACGVIDPSSFRCEVVDNYAYRDSSEVINSGGFYVSRNTPATDIQDSFEVYVNPGDDQTWESLSFTDGISGTVRGNGLDGSLFTDDFCENQQGDFIYNVETAPYFDHKTTVATTKYSEQPEDKLESHLTTYEQNNHASGRMYFRSYNDVNQSEISVALSDVIGNFNYFDDSDHDKIFDDITSGNIIDMDIIYDNIIILTPTHMLIEKINFDQMTSKLKPNNTTHVLIRTNYGDPREMSMRWFFNEHDNKLITGHTSVVNDVVFPRVFEVDLNTLNYRQTFPEKDSPGDIDKFILSEDLSGFKVKTIDAPIIKFDDKVNEYNISYSAMLSGGDSEVYTIFTSDFRNDKHSMRLREVAAFHGEIMPEYVYPGASWERPVNSRTIRLEGDLSDLPQSGEVKTISLSLESMTGHTLSGLELELNIVNRYIPVDPDSYRVLQLVFDPGDDTDVQIIDRVIDDGLGSINVNITDLPDSSDYGDPRVHEFTYRYKFDKSTPHTYAARVSAIYSDFSVLVYDLSVETEPYTTQSAFSGLKLIESRPYIDINNKRKQLLTLETQSPRYISNVVIDK